MHDEITEGKLIRQLFWKDEEIDSLKDKLEAWKESYLRLKDKLEEEKEASDQLLEHRNALVEKVSRLKKKEEEAGLTLMNAEAVKNYLMEEANEASNSYTSDRLAKQRDALDGHYGRLLDAKDDEIADLRAQLGLASEDLGILKVQLADHENCRRRFGFEKDNEDRERAVRLADELLSLLDERDWAND